MKKVVCYIAFSVVGWLIQPSLLAQPMDADSLLTAAQHQAFSQQYDSAILTLRMLLANKPEHYDAHLLLGSVYGWNGDHHSARLTYQTLISRYPTAEAYQGGVRVEMGAASWEDALSLVGNGLAQHPSDQTLRILKAQILTHLGYNDEAIATLESDSSSSPHADSLLADLYRARTKHALRLGYYYAFFDRLFTPWHIGTLEYQRRTNAGPVIGRINVARMFDQIGHQFEIDAYPKLAHRTYAYLNVGVSDRTIFPRVRWGAELFHGFRSGIEVSGGMRALYFEVAPAYIYTAQVTRYAASHRVSARAYLTSLRATRSISGSITYRKHLKNRDHYFSLYADYGNTPFQVVSLAEIARLTTQRAAVDYQHPLINRTLLVRWLVELQYETYDEQRETNRWGVGVQLEKRF